MLLRLRHFSRKLGLLALPERCQPRRSRQAMTSENAAAAAAAAAADDDDDS